MNKHSTLVMRKIDSDGKETLIVPNDIGSILPNTCFVCNKSIATEPQYLYICGGSVSCEDCMKNSKSDTPAGSKSTICPICKNSWSKPFVYVPTK